MTITTSTARLRLACLLSALGCAALLVACSGASPLSPSALGGASSTFSTADHPASGDPRNSEPTDAPQDFTFVWQGDQETSAGRNSFFVSWRPVVNVTKYEVSFERRERQANGREGWTVLPALFVHPPTKAQGIIPDGVWRARVRSVFAGQTGNWSAYVVQSRETPTAPVEIEDCAWEEEQPKFWRLVFRRRVS